MAAASSPVRVGLDLARGITTILVKPSPGELVVEQLPVAATATLAARCTAAIAAVRRIADREPLAVEVTYTTPTTTQALLGGPLPRVALLVSEGFTDVLRIGRQALPDARFTAACCLPVPERLAADGSVVTALTDEALLALRQQVGERAVDAVAVTLLHSYKDAQHEQRLAHALADLPQPVLLSSEVLPIPGEFERASATVLAAVSAVAQAAEVSALRAALPPESVIRSVQGDGTARALPSPLRGLLGDVAAGLIGIEKAAAALLVPQFLSLGIGETISAAAHHDGTLALVPKTALLGLPLCFPTLAAALCPVGATTLFDKDAPDELAPAAVAQLVEAVWAAAVAQGHDPADFPLLCYGQSAGLIAARVAAQLGIRKVIIPPAAHLLTAYGALSAPVFRERTQTLRCEGSRAQQLGTVEATLRALADSLRRELSAEGHPEGGAGTYPIGARDRWQWSAELRYDGQSHALTLPGLGEGSPSQDGVTDLVVRFHQEHERRYGYTIAERQVILERVCVRVSVPVATPDFADLVKAARAAYSPSATPTAAAKNAGVTGPAIIEGDCGRTRIPSGFIATVSEDGAILLAATPKDPGAVKAAAAK